MINIKTTVQQIGSIVPEIKLTKKAFEQIGDIAAASILRNIQNQRRADGGKLQRNYMTTIAAKRRRGRAAKSLIDKKRRFVNGKGPSWHVMATDRKVIIQPSNAELKRLVHWVQLPKKVKGTGRSYLTREGYKGWFGINKQGQGLIRKIVRKAISDLFAKAARRGRRK